MLAAELMVAQNIAFYVIAAIMVFAAIRVVTVKNMVHAALWLVTVLAGIAAQFILLAAEFAAVTQVLVYIGAIIVLFLFGIMLTRAPMGKADDINNGPTARIAAVVIGVVLAGVLGFALWDGFRDTEFNEMVVQRVGADPSAPPELQGGVADSIFGNYLLAFEVVSVLLLAALIGAIVLARRD